MRTKYSNLTDDELITQVLVDPGSTEREIEMAARMATLVDEVADLTEDILGYEGAGEDEVADDTGG